MENIFQKGENITIKAALTVVGFAVAKSIVGFLSGSIVLVADGIHSAADSFSTFLVWLGLKIAKKKPTEKFQYGYYKAENLSTFLVSGLIFYAGFEIVRSSVHKLFTSYQLHIPLIAISVAILDAIVMFLVGTYEVKVGREIHAQSLIADGSESRMHLFSSSVVLLGLLSSYFKIPYIEGIAGIIISGFIFSVGIESARDSILALMDVSPNKEIEDKIKQIISKFAELESFSGLKLRKSGPFIFGEIRVRMKKNISVERAHEVTERLEQEIKSKIPQVDSFLINVEPFEKEERKIVIPVKEENGIESKICNIFSRAKFFAIVSIKDKKVEDIKFKRNPFQDKEIRAGLAVAKFLLAEKPDILITKEMGPIAFHTLRDNLVEIYKADQDTVKQVIEEFLSERLARLGEPTKIKK